MKANRPLPSEESVPKTQEQAQLTPHQKEVIRATQVVLDCYAKTFKDLARYDRGEKLELEKSR